MQRVERIDFGNGWSVVQIWQHGFLKQCWWEKIDD